MVQLFGDSNNIYSVDMMHAYVNLFKSKVISIPVENLLHELNQNCWGNPQKKIKFSPKDVLEHPTNKMYEKNMQKIGNADLKYPILIYNNNIVDGMHRLAKANLQGKKKIKAHIFTKKEMKWFLIDKNKDYDRIFGELRENYYIEKFFKTFCNKNMKKK